MPYLNFDRSIVRPAYLPYLYAGLILVVYWLGLLIPMFDNDSAHHALIGMRMYLTGDYVDLIDRGRDYLDKPHLLFWLAALGDGLLGVSTLAYKLPTFLLAFPGIYATYRLAVRLYNRQAGVHAALILVTSQAYILAHHDVRMDALLLSLIITATWLLYEFTLTYKPWTLISGTLFLALAFATKGMSGVALPVIAVGSQLLFQRNWAFIRSFKWAWAVPLFFILISPVLYCYYLQYDLHPEKVIRGMRQISGVAFILFFQNTERFDGVSWGSSGANDPFLFFHSLLWALLPWCLLGYWAVFRRGLRLVRTGYACRPGEEMLSWSAVVIMFIILTSSQFRLPHYLNILFPFFSLLIAGELSKVREGSGESKWLMIVQQFVVAAMILATVVINGFFFPVNKMAIIMLAAVAFALLIYEWLFNTHFPGRLVMVSVCASLVANILLNGNFYPKIQLYQAGHHIADRINQLGIPEDKVVVSGWESPSMNYYASYFFEESPSEKLMQRTDIWVAAPSDTIQKIVANGQFHAKQVYWFADFDTTKLKFEFVNPATRQSACKTIGLVHLVKE